MILEKITEPVQEKQIDFTGKLQNKNIHKDLQILIAVGWFSKWPTVKLCETPETKEVKSFFGVIILYTDKRRKSNQIKEAPLSRNNTGSFVTIGTWNLDTARPEYMRELKE